MTDLRLHTRLARDFRRSRIARIGGGLGELSLLLISGLFAAFPANLAAQSVWELSPYRVRTAVIAPNAPECSEMTGQLVASIALRLESLVGAAWQLDAAPAESDEVAAWRLGDGAHDPVIVPPLWSKTEYDKVFLLRVHLAMDGAYVAAREWDAATCRLGLEAGQFVVQPGRLRDAAVEVLLQAFRPLARIDRIEVGESGQRAVLRVRAGGLPTRDPELQWVVPGRLFCPIVRANDREGRLRRDAEGQAALPQPVPWTFLATEEVRGVEASCRVESGLQSPLSASRRGRVMQLALGVTPHARPTRLTVLARREPHEPVAGYDVFLQQPGQRTTSFLGRTDGAGAIDIAPGGDALSFVLVRSGRQLLARLPVATGFADSATAYLPDDVVRLEAEAFVVALQEQLVDVVTQREVLLARAESQLDAGSVNGAKQLLVKLEQLPDREMLRRRLVTRQSQLRSSDPHVQRQIEALFRDTATLLDGHLSPDPVAALAKAIAKHADHSPSP